MGRKCCHGDIVQRHWDSACIGATGSTGPIQDSGLQRGRQQRAAASLSGLLVSAVLAHPGECSGLHCSGLAPASKPSIWVGGRGETCASRLDSALPLASLARIRRHPILRLPLAYLETAALLCGCTTRQNLASRSKATSSIFGFQRSQYFCQKQSQLPNSRDPPPSLGWKSGMTAFPPVGTPRPRTHALTTLSSQPAHAKDSVLAWDDFHLYLVHCQGLIVLITELSVPVQP